jgi:hypothetical protein
MRANALSIRKLGELCPQVTFFDTKPSRFTQRDIGCSLSQRKLNTTDKFHQGKTNLKSGKFKTLVD